MVTDYPVKFFPYSLLGLFVRKPHKKCNEIIFLASYQQNISIIKMKRRNILAIIALTTIGWTMASCHNYCIDGNGNAVTESRIPTGDFDEISVAANFNAVVTPYTKDSISVEAESNLMPYIITEVSGNRLILRTPTNNCVDPQKPIVIHVFAKNVGRLDISGSGSITTDPITTGDLAVNISGSGKISANTTATKVSANISGSGNIVLTGSATDANYRISGSGNIDASALISQNCYSVISGSGNIYCSATDKLDVTISGSGSVYYKGTPGSVNANISGSGKLVQSN